MNPIQNKKTLKEPILHIGFVVDVPQRWLMHTKGWSLATQQQLLLQMKLVSTIAMTSASKSINEMFSYLVAILFLRRTDWKENVRNTEWALQSEGWEASKSFLKPYQTSLRRICCCYSWSWFRFCFRSLKSFVVLEATSLRGLGLLTTTTID